MKHILKYDTYKATCLLSLNGQLESSRNPGSKCMQWAFVVDLVRELRFFLPSASCAGPSWALLALLVLSAFWLGVGCGSGCTFHLATSPLGFSSTLLEEELLRNLASESSFSLVSQVPSSGALAGARATRGQPSVRLRFACSGISSLGETRDLGVLLLPADWERSLIQASTPEALERLGLPSSRKVAL